MLSANIMRGLHLIGQFITGQFIDASMLFQNRVRFVAFYTKESLQLPMSQFAFAVHLYSQCFVAYASRSPSTLRPNLCFKVAWQFDFKSHTPIRITYPAYVSSDVHLAQYRPPRYSLKVTKSGSRSSIG